MILVIPLSDSVLKLNVCDPLNAGDTPPESGERSAVRLRTQIWILQVCPSSDYSLLVLRIFYRWDASDKTQLSSQMLHFHPFNSLILVHSIIKMWLCRCVCGNEWRGFFFLGSASGRCSCGKYVFPDQVSHSPSLISFICIRIYNRFQFPSYSSNLTLRMSK